MFATRGSKSSTYRPAAVGLFEPLEPRQLLAAHLLADYFPLAASTTWSYAGTLNGAPATAAASVTAGPVLSGIQTSRLRTVFSPNDGGPRTQDDRFYAHTATGLRLLGENLVEPSLTDNVLFGPGVRLSTTLVNDGATIHFTKSLNGTSSEGRSWTGNFVGDTFIKGVEVIDTTAGSFEALKISIVGSITENGSTGWTATGTLQETRWLALGIGTVRLDYAMQITSSDQAAESLRVNMGLTASSRLGAVTDENVRGKGVIIAYGDTSPGAGDSTNFAGVDVNGGTKTRIFKIDNTSSHAITLSQGTQGFITIQGVNAAEFTVVRQPAHTILPGQTTLFSVRFMPGGLGFRYATVSFATQGDTSHPFYFDVRGTGIHVGRIHVTGSGSASSISNGATSASVQAGTRFGQMREAGTAHVARTFVISNTGIGNLVLFGTPRIVISGTQASDFAITHAAAGSIAPGSTSAFTIQFDPADLGLRTAVVSILSNDSTMRLFTFTIVGTGIA